MVRDIRGDSLEEDVHAPGRALMRSEGEGK